MRIPSALAAILGGLCWLGLVMLRLRSVEERLWIARDDAVITLSHARNAAEFGSIGVSPGGDRVEGFSSPLHFALSYLVHLVADPGYRTVSMIILISSAAMTGACVVTVLRWSACQLGADSLWVDATAVFLTGAAAAWVIASWTSIGWIGSGMENPVVILAAVAAVAAATTVPSLRTQALLAITLGLFAVSRVEFAAFSVPFVFAAAWAHSSSGPAARRLRSSAETVGAALTLVIMVHVARRLYFGEWLPNTAVVQGRASGSNQLLVAALISAMLLAFVVHSAARTSAITASRPQLARQSGLIAAGLYAGLVVLNSTGQTSGTLTELLELKPIVPLVVLITVLIGVDRAGSNRRSSIDAVFLSLAVIPLAQYVALGPARLEAYRIAVLAVPFLAFWAASLALRIVVLLRDVRPLPTFLAGRRRAAMACVLVAVATVGLAFTASADGSRRLNWEISNASELTDVVDQVREEQLAGSFAILANPDLGKVSYEKNSIIVDLGLLGDPLLTTISEERPELVIPYLHFIARPDVLEAHGFWSCTYAAWLNSAEFASAYAPQDDAMLGGAPPMENCAYGGRRVIWLRTDADAEYALTRELMTTPDPALVIRRAIGTCKATAGDAFRCQGVRRSLQRAAGQLQSTGTYRQAVDEMATSPSAALDTPLLLRGPGWAGDALDGLLVAVGG